MTLLREMLDELEAASKRLKEAMLAEEAAHANCTEIRQQVSNIQKAIDSELDKIKAEAAWSTEWHSQRNHAGARIAP